MSVRYRNIETESVSTYATTIPRLERSDQWERVDDDVEVDVPDVDATADDDEPEDG